MGNTFGFARVLATQEKSSGNYVGATRAATESGPTQQRVSPSASPSQPRTRAPAVNYVVFSVGIAWKASWLTRSDNTSTGPAAFDEADAILLLHYVARRYAPDLVEKRRL